MKENKLFKRLVIFAIAVFMCLSTVSIVSADITGSDITATTTSYTPGTSVTLQFHFGYSSSDWEYIDGCYLDFPNGVTVDDASDCGALSWNSETGNGVQTSWGSITGHSWWGDLYGDEDFTVDVTIDPGFSGDMVIDWFINGDGYGGTPHELYGSMTIVEADFCPLPFSEGFEGYQPAFPPPGWNVYNLDGSDQWVQYLSKPHTGAKCARCWYDTTNDDWLVSKGIVQPASPGNFELFLAAHSSYYSEPFEIYYSTTGNTPADFYSGTLLLAGTETSLAPTYTFYTFPIPEAPGTTVWYAVHYVGAFDYGLYADDFIFPDGSTEGFEGSEAGFPPSGWTEEIVASGYTDPDWTATDVETSYPYAATPHSGSYMGMFNSYHASTGTKARLYTPELNLSGCSAPMYEISFWMWHGNYADDYIVVQASTDAVIWNDLGTFYRNDGTSGWFEHSFDISAYGSGTVYIGFLGVSDYGHDMFIDDIVIGELIEIHDVGTVSIDTPAVTGPMSQEIDATVHNYGTETEDFTVSCIVLEQPSTFKFLDNFDDGVMDTGVVIEDILGPHDDKITSIDLGETDPHAGESQWTASDSDGDGVTWHTTTHRTETGTGYSLYSGDETTYTYGSPSSDYAFSDWFYTGYYVNVVVEFDVWYDLEAGYDYLKFGWSDGYYLWMWSSNKVTGDSNGWVHIEYTIPYSYTNYGDTYLWFRLSADYSGSYEGAYIDNIYVTSSGGIVYTDSESVTSFASGSDATVTFSTDSDDWLPEQDKVYTIQVCTNLNGDIDYTNNCQETTIDAGGCVYNVDKGLWYLDIQSAIDEADPGNTIIVYDGTFNEDVTVDVEGLTLSAVNPPTSTSIIYGTVDIIADGVTFENFKVIPGGLYTASEAGISIAANDVTVQNNIIEGMTGEVADTMFTIKGIHVYGGGPDSFENIVIQNNIVRNIVNTNQTGGGGGCAYEICLTDSYGDGWNGGYLDIYVNGAPVHMGLTIVSGAGPVCEFIPVVDGDAIFLDYTYGGWAYENYWELKDNDGIVVFSTWGGSSDTAYDHTEIASGCPPPAVTSTYGGADGIMIQGFLDDVQVLNNHIENIHSAGWCYGVEITPTFAPPYFGSDVIFNEDFASCPDGWTMTDPAGGGTWLCTTSIPSWTISPMGPVAGTFMMIDDDAIDDDNYDEQLISPVIDCSGYTNVDLDYDGCFNSVYTGTPYPSSDYLNVEVYDGSAWQQVGTFPTYDDDIGFGSTGPYDISAYADGNANMQIRFVFNDYGSWAWGAIIDNVIVTGDPSGPSGGGLLIEGNYFTEIGDGSVYSVWDEPGIAPYPGVMFTVDESYPGADDGDATVVTLTKNIFDNDCSVPILAVINKDTDGILDAEMNYWGNILGPGSYGGPVYDAVTGKLADAETFSCSIVDCGPVHFEPWVGIDAVATASDFSVETGEAVIFNAAGSFAADFDGVYTPEYYWSFGDGFHSNEEQIGHSYDSPGTYEVYLRVQGQGLGSLYSNFMYDWAYLTITVTSPGAPLSANADGGNLGSYETIVGETLQLYGVATGGEEPYIFHWDLGNGKTSKDASPTTEYKDPGTYTVILTVTDSMGATASDTADVTVLARDELIASAGGPYNGVPSVPVFFYSDVIGGTGPYTYTWDLGDGTLSGLVSPIHAYDEAGTYTVTLTVEDSLGEIDTDTTIVTVEAADEDEAIIGEIQGGLGVKATITAGSEPVDWTINVDGRVFMGGYASGSISASATETVGIPFSLGIGNVDITITANSITKECTAFMIGPFVLIK